VLIEEGERRDVNRLTNDLCAGGMKAGEDGVKPKSFEASKLLPAATRGAIVRSATSQRTLPERSPHALSRRTPQ
jgi:hypothetical protein